MPNQSDQIVLSIDSSKGGNGDIWMRLVSFYSMAKLTSIRFELQIPVFLEGLAKYTFGDRLHFIRSDQASLYYTNLGIKDLIKPILQGKRFLSPYQRAVIHDKKKTSLKDSLNKFIFNLADWIGVIQVPDEKWIPFYQGYLDVIGIKSLRSVSYEDFIAQLQTDAIKLRSKLVSGLPVSPELTLPADLAERILIFPTGTSRQFVPVHWAIQYLPDAYYAFFHKDADADAFIKNGLSVVFFYKEPGDIIQLSHAAYWTISTDSFPSHLLQTASERCTITITEVLKSRIINPSFTGEVIDAVAPCHPCLHLDRKNHPTCAAGFTECINWNSPVYSHNILSSIPSRS